MSTEALSDDAAVEALMAQMDPTGPNETDNEDNDDAAMAALMEQMDEDGEDDLDDAGDPDDAADTDLDPAGPEGADGSAEQAPAAPVAIADDAVVKVAGADGTEQEYTVAQLKEYAAQNEHVQQLQQVTTQRAQQTAFFLQNAINEVAADVAPYEGVDWLVLQTQLAPEEFQWHRENFQKAQGRMANLQNSFSQMEQQQQARRNEQLQQEAAEGLRVLRDPQQGIEGWNDELYDQITSFAVQAGLPADEVNQITNPHVIKIINDARLYRAAQAKQPAQKNLTASNVRQAAGDQQLQSQKQTRIAKLERKARSGNMSEQDAMALLASRM